MANKFGSGVQKQTKDWTKWTDGDFPTDGTLSTDKLESVRSQLERKERRIKMKLRTERH